MDEMWFLVGAGLTSILNILVIILQNRLENFQKVLFRVSMLTGWVLLAAIMMIEPTTDGLTD
jgi:4-hydroxybenzoate polyprenyltransferase